MANNCDYCHKPLSLMRRLRGEQFCSVEHLDKYAAQQAEFALERLAASVSEKSSTDRPPALPRPAPKLRPISATNREAAQQAPPASAQPAVAIQERELVAETSPVPVARPAAMPESDTEFPMAPYLGHTAIEPRSFETIGNRKSGYAPAVTWGKIAPTWSMPPFQSEPGDPRTWNAGRLVSQIPPVAGWRELLSPQDAEPVESTSEVDAQLPFLDVAVENLQAVSTSTHLKNTFPERLTDYRNLTPQRGTVETVIQAYYPADFTTPNPVFTAIGESVRAGFRVAGSRLEQVAAVGTELRPLPSTFGLCELSGPEVPAPPHAPAILVFTRTGISRLASSGAQRTGARLATSGMDFGPGVEPAMPLSMFRMPHPEGWSWTHSFTVSKVDMPDLVAVQMLHPNLPLGTGDDWQDPKGTVRGPAIQRIAPHLGYNGPNFGWEGSLIKPLLTATEYSSTASEPARFVNVEALGATPRLQELRARVSVGLEIPSRRVRQGWYVPRTDAAKFEVGPLVTLRPTVTALDVQVRPFTTFVTAHLEQVTGATRHRKPQAGENPAVSAMEASFRSPEIVSNRAISLPGPIPTFGRRGAVAPSPMVHSQITEKIAHLGPIKYSPVAIVVLPPPQFALLPAAMTEEQRYVAQVPNGVWRLPRVRHTGYRAVGPFPKLPIRFPDRYFKNETPVMHPAFEEIPRTRVTVHEDQAGLPTFAAPTATHIHPADYFVWPTPKAVKSARMHPERLDLPGGTGVRNSIKRFGPGRAGLQGRSKNADGQARGKA